MLDSVNAGSMRGFEANKTWRFEPYRYGGILEPMIGLRYAGFQDLAVNTQYVVSVGTVTNQFGTNISQEQFTREMARIDNNMLLGQFGFRYTKAVRRWTFSNDSKVFAGHVYQNREFSTDVFNNYFAATIAAGDDPIQELDREGTTFSSSRMDSTTVGFDIRVEAAYKAFKGVDLRAGSKCCTSAEVSGEEPRQSRWQPIRQQSTLDYARLHRGFNLEPIKNICEKLRGRVVKATRPFFILRAEIYSVDLDPAFTLAKSI